MPDTAVLDAPITDSQSPTGTSSISQFTSEMAQTVAKASAPKPEPEPEPEAPAETEPQPETPQAETEKAPEKPAEPAKEKDKPLTEWTEKDFDAAMKKAPSKAWKIYEFFKNKTASTIKDLEGKIKAVESKPVESPADAKKIEAYEKQIKELGDSLTESRKTIAELDYSRSPEFKRDYTERLTSAYQAAVEDIKQLTVTEGETTRPATQQDFDLLMRLPVREQIIRAKAMFGDTAEAFFAHRNEVQRIQRDGREALARAQEEAESRRTQMEVQTKEGQRQYESTLDAEMKDMAKNLPDYFGETDNQTASEAFKRGLELTKQLLSDRDKASPREKASIDALLQSTHAGFRRMVVENSVLKTERDALKAELEKYRASDPGNAGGKKAPKAASDDDIGGIDAMSAKFVRAT